MSTEDFNTLLGDSNQAGVYRLPQHGIGDLSAAADNRHMALFRVELEHIESKEAFLAQVARALHFPVWFGDNWDALEDCLTDLSWIDAASYVVILAHADPFRTSDETGFLTALRIFQSAAEYWRKERVPLWTLVELRRDGIALLSDLP
jgi:RNAse (barnase) inhibitor barstar